MGTLRRVPYTLEVTHRNPGTAKSGAKSHPGKDVENNVSPIQLAIAVKKLDSVRCLAQYGKLPQTELDNALIGAGKYNFGEAVALLAYYGASVNTRNQYGYTALHYAASEGNSPTVNILIKHGAKLDIVADDGHSPYTLAEIMGHVDIANLLKPPKVNP